MRYERKVRYLDYYEEGQRAGSGGFAKLEVWDGRLRMELSLTGRRPTDSFVRDVVLCGGGKEGSVGRIEIAEGRGRFAGQWQDMENIGGSRIAYGELDGIRILLGAGREVSCRWRAAGRTVEHGRSMESGMTMEHGQSIVQRRAVVQNRIEEKFFDEPQGEVEAEEMPDIPYEEEGKAETDSADETADGGGQKAGGSTEQGWSVIKGRNMDQGRSEMEGRNIKQGRSAIEGRNMDQGHSVVKDCPINQGRSIIQNRTMIQGRTIAQGQSMVQGQAMEMRMNLMEDKWLQMWAVYPHICPFQDEREYLSISPSDFVLFPAATYRAVNNSFLLHGYYNYRHLILARAERKGEQRYYIGVPGSFYEREKQVAIMFGFESFECAEEPAQPGDFGYYMMRTEV